MFKTALIAAALPLMLCASTAAYAGDSTPTCAGNVERLTDGLRITGEGDLPTHCLFRKPQDIKTVLAACTIGEHCFVTGKRGESNQPGSPNKLQICLKDGRHCSPRNGHIPNIADNVMVITGVSDVFR